MSMLQTVRCSDGWWITGWPQMRIEDRGSRGEAQSSIVNPKSSIRADEAADGEGDDQGPYDTRAEAEIDRRRAVAKAAIELEGPRAAWRFHSSEPYPTGVLRERFESGVKRRAMAWNMDRRVKAKRFLPDAAHVAGATGVGQAGEDPGAPCVGDDTPAEAGEICKSSDAIRDKTAAALQGFLFA